MLCFCSVEDIKGVIVSASRFDGPYDDVRHAVTQDMNNYIRRNLEYTEGVVEYFDTRDVNVYESFTVWLDKKAVVPSSLVLRYSRSFIWDDDDLIVPTGLITLDAARGKLTVRGATRRGARTLRVSYDGGYPALPELPAATPVILTNTMDCPANLKNAAIAECSYRLDKLLNVNVGNKGDVTKKLAVPQEAFVGPLLRNTAMSINEFRKPLG